MLRILQIEEIERKLLEVSDLVDIQDESYTDFLDSLDKWLRDLDGILQKNRLAISGSVSALRGTLISTRNGAIYQDVDFVQRPTRRKRLTAAGLDILKRAINKVESSIYGDRIRFEEAERIALQVISIARTAAIIEDGNPNSNPRVAQDLIAKMKNSKSTIQGVVQLEGLVGHSDAIIFIDRFLYHE